MRPSSDIVWCSYALRLSQWKILSRANKMIILLKLQISNAFNPFSSVQPLSHDRLFAIPWMAAHQASLSFTISWSLLRLMSFESVMPSNHLILCFPLLFLPSIFPSIKIFSSESVLHIKWPKCWSFSISPSNEHSGLISFEINWFDHLADQGTLKSLLQHHSLLYVPTLTSIQDYWANHSFKYMDFCQENDFSFANKM